MKQNIFYKADPLIFGQAKELRNRLTDAENLFWFAFKRKFQRFINFEDNIQF